MVRLTSPQIPQEIEIVEMDFEGSINDQEGVID